MDKGKESKRNILEINCREDIIRLPDVTSLRALKKQWNVKSSGPLRNRDDYIRALLDFYDRRHERKDKPNSNAGLAEAIHLDSLNRAKLQEMYDQILGFYNTLPPQYQKSLNSAYPDLVNKMTAKRKELDSSDIVILVAGETGAGKSSFINLLLETDILPVYAIEATQTICELRKSKNGKKEAFCFYKRGTHKKARAPKVIKIDGFKGVEELRKRIKEKDTDEQSPYERIEINMPFRMLEDGVVIVDSPGFGENGKRSGELQRYITHSFGAIYLVNTASAGGVNSGRLRDFLRSVVNSAGDDFNPSATIFIGNKIDSVDPKDQQEVKQTTSLKLKQCYPGLKDSSIFFMSVKEALQSVSFDTRTEDHEDVLVQGIQKLFPAVLRNKLSIHYRLQSQILKRTLVSVAVSRTMAVTGKENRQNEIADIQRRMNTLEQNAKATIHNLKIEIGHEEARLYEDLLTCLRDRAFTEKVFGIQKTDCARLSKDWKEVAEDANNIISSKIAREIDKWEHENQFVGGIKARILDKFNNDCQGYEDQLKEIESALLGGDIYSIKDLHKSMKRQAPVRQIWAKAKDVGPIDDKISSLGAIVSSAGGLSTRDKRVKDICRAYKSKTQLESMKSLVYIYIENIFEGNDLKMKTINFVTRFAKGLDTIAKKIPDFIHADTELIENIQEEIRNAEYNLKEVFPKILQEGKKLQGKLDIFYINEIMEMDFRLQDINYNPSEDFLGSGSFADVYKAKLVCFRPPLEVALKISKKGVQENNVSDLLLEDRTMRDLDHKNIVQYYGASVRKENIRGKIGLYWIMIMEYCSGTLKEKIINEDYNNPGRVGKMPSVQVKQMEEIARMVMEICEGLRYIHNKDMVHRDLKLENVLIAVDVNGKEILKLADVGLTKSVTDIDRTVAGSPAYMAPEVLLQTGKHSCKADIYSLAIVIWEMWYGIDAAEHIKSQLFGTLHSAIKGGLRPSISLEQKPPSDWMALIKRCWDHDPTNRPEVDEVWTFFDNFVKH